MSDDHAHDSEELELDPDEPHTPWWMPLLGGFLFLMAALVAVAASDADDESGALPGDPAAEGTVADEAAPDGRGPAPAADDHAGHGHD